MAHWELFRAYYSRGEINFAQNALERYLYLTPSDISKYLAILKHGLPLSKNQISFNRLIRYNLEKIVEIAQKRGIKIVLQNYPHNYSLGLEIKDIALKNKVQFLDNALIFDRLELQENYNYTDYFAEDNHCNRKGYSVMVKNIYDVIKN